MVVILDTNILIKCPRMDSNFHKLLYDYLEKTDSHILLPKLVLDESKTVYKRTLHEKYEKYQEKGNLLNSLLISRKELESIDIDKEVENFTSHILSIYSKFYKEYLIEYDLMMLEEAVRRAINKIRPCSEKKEEFRDTLLWLTVLNVAKSQDEKNIVFISENTSDFCSANNQLHPDLVKDLKDNDIQVFYFQSIESFIEKYADKINKLTEDSVENYLSENNVEIEVFKLLDRGIFKDIIQRFLEHKYDDIDDLELIDHQILLNTYSLYEMKDKTYLLITLCNYVLDVQFSHEDNDDSYSGFFGIHKYSDKQLRLELKIQFELNDEFDVMNWDLLDIEDIDYN